MSKRQVLFSTILDILSMTVVTKREMSCERVIPKQILMLISHYDESFIKF